MFRALGHRKCRRPQCSTGGLVGGRHNCWGNRRLDNGAVVTGVDDEVLHGREQDVVDKGATVGSMARGTSLIGEFNEVLAVFQSERGSFPFGLAMPRCCFLIVDIKGQVVAVVGNGLVTE